MKRYVMLIIGFATLLQASTQESAAALTAALKRTTQVTAKESLHRSSVNDGAGKTPTTPSIPVPPSPRTPARKKESLGSSFFAPGTLLPVLESRADALSQPTPPDGTANQGGGLGSQATVVEQRRSLPEGVLTDGETTEEEENQDVFAFEEER